MFMATAKLVIDLSLFVIVANLEKERGFSDHQGLATWSAFNLGTILSDFSGVMTCVGFTSYLLLLFHLFVLPNCPSVSDLLTLFNVG